MAYAGPPGDREGSGIDRKLIASGTKATITASISFMIAMTLAMLAFLANDDKVVVSKEPISEQQLQVYEALLNSSKGSKTMNLVVETTPFRPDDYSSQCIRSLSVSETALTSSTVHRFGNKEAERLHVVLVERETQQQQVQQTDPSDAIRRGDPVNGAVEKAFASGYLFLSEVLFDTTGKRAILKFGFHCGGLCGHGATVVLEKRSGKWKMTKRDCGRWIS